MMKSRVQHQTLTREMVEAMYNERLAERLTFRELGKRHGRDASSLQTYFRKFGFPAERLGGGKRMVTSGKRGRGIGDKMEVQTRFTPGTIEVRVLGPRGFNRTYEPLAGNEREAAEKVVAQLEVLERLGALADGSYRIAAGVLGSHVVTFDVERRAA